VDVQVIERGNAGLTVRRMLENVEVLSTGSPNGLARPDVTVLATPDDADKLSLADASMSLRVVLRNPSDKSVAGPVAMRAQPK
jgi:Flp pilus assembly protein CpaB